MAEAGIPSVSEVKWGDPRDVLIKASKVLTMCDFDYYRTLVNCLIIESSNASQAAEEEKASLVVVGRRGLSGMRRVLMGSVSQYLASKTDGGSVYGVEELCSRS